VDLSPSQQPTGNSGDTIEVARLEVPAGTWRVDGRVNLFVPDAAGTFKNTPGCGIYADGVQVAGAFGQSNRWIATVGASGWGKFVSTELLPWLTTPSWAYEEIVVAGPTVLTMTCFINQSHGGAKLEDRAGMAAHWIELRAEELPAT